ncbi:putative calcium-binding protein [Ceratocystis lukuohia]|uniref:Calcium-binding protein n=3 Tax=Ceratocystis TaxID=5157 RepID=A0ABR4MR88_9PEZI|nr:putative calcium-binding protein [Ceratocystis platani]PHH53570.1 putative calcium-binding protein [Ceratocystis fimbriata CBS 114723]
MRPILAIAFAASALAHGSHSNVQKPIVPDDANWMTKHMAEEHHMAAWDADSFFTLHDFNGDGFWQTDELLRLYGLMDESNKDLPDRRREEISFHIMEMLDQDRNYQVSRKEFLDFIAKGATLPDMGTGPGHHGDDEYEYEIHHWEKYHNDDTKLEDLTHPEDIEHFKKHEQMEIEEERLQRLEKQAIVLENIPGMFMRS